jgi:hypothetical protein
MKNFVKLSYLFFDICLLISVSSRTMVKGGYHSEGKVTILVDEIETYY